MSESAWLDVRAVSVVFFFFFNDTATTEIYTLSLHDALPILPRRRHHAARLAARPGRGRGGRGGRPGARAPAARAARVHRRGPPGPRLDARLAPDHERLLPRGAGGHGGHPVRRRRLVRGCGAADRQTERG